MKKTYMHPTTQIVKIETTQMIAGSLGYGGSTTESSGNLSRDDSAWDDDEY